GEEELGLGVAGVAPAVAHPAPDLARQVVGAQLLEGLAQAPVAARLLHDGDRRGGGAQRVGHVEVAGTAPAQDHDAQLAHRPTPWRAAGIGGTAASVMSMSSASAKNLAAQLGNSKRE